MSADHDARGMTMVAAGASIEFLAPARLGERLIAMASETSRAHAGDDPRVFVGLIGAAENHIVHRARIELRISSHEP